MTLGFRKGGLAAILVALGSCSASDDPGSARDVAPSPAPDPRDDDPLPARFGRPSEAFAWRISGGNAPPDAPAAEAAVRYAGDLRAVEAGGRRSAEPELVSVHDTGRGAIVVRLEQRVGGVEVYPGELRVLMRRDRSLVGIAGTIATYEAGATLSFVSTPARAVAAALAASAGAELSAPMAEAEPRDGYDWFDLGGKVSAASDFEPTEPARAKPVLMRAGTGLVPAYYVEIVGNRPSDGAPLGEALIVADVDGRVLLRSNLVHSVAFNYRVFVDATGDRRALDGPTVDVSPHPTGDPSGYLPASVSPVLVSMEGFNTNPSGVADPWLPIGATATVGNNVDAYTDTDAPDGFTAGSDFRATVTSAGTFDRVYDPTLSPLANQGQGMAAAAHLFYTMNWAHDWYYDSGFDEAAGVAQDDNFGRGGAGSDRLLAELQDNAQSELDNANMLTPADGASPRLQIYIWSAPPEQSITVTPGGATYATGAADFGPQTFDVTDTVVLANDGAGVVTDACEAITNSVAGSIVLADRGTCTFKEKALNVQAAGAVGIVIANDVVGAPPGMTGSGAGTVVIPTASVTLAAGTALKTAISSGPTTVRMVRQPGVIRDGALDATVTMHEWGHYLHYRLGGGCANAQCDALSEGWGDVVALHHMLRNGDALGGTYAIGAYAGAALADAYFGLRRAPYSVDPSKNAFSFRHIGDGEALPSHPLIDLGPNSEVHNAGEIFAIMMFDAYVAMLNAATGPTPPYSFDEARRRMSDYVVAGLKMTPFDATFLEQRDALIAAAAASDPADGQRFAQAFAGRGAGTCAVGPSRTSTDLTGVVESFDLDPLLGGIVLELAEASPNCDGDGILDAGERGIVRVQVGNIGGATLSGATVTISSPTPGVTFPAGPLGALPDVAPFGTNGIVDIPVALDPTFSGVALDVDASISAPTACTTSASSSGRFTVHIDETPNASTTDDVEASSTTWTIAGSRAETVWSRSAVQANDLDWVGIDAEVLTDAQLVSPPLTVAAGPPLVMTFRHHHSFEFGFGLSFDGGVIEISQDGGAWVDAATVGTVAYNGTITDISGNVLGGRPAFVRDTSGYPNDVTSTVNFGTSFAGSTVQVRFRIGTDEAVGAPGWTIDEIAFSGITNMPFPTVSPEAVQCSPSPISVAGPDQSVTALALVQLDGSASSDPADDALTFSWVQIGGPSVSLSGASTATPSFTAPDVAVATTLTFELTVSDGSANATDAVSVVVEPLGGTGGSGGAGGTGPGDAGLGTGGVVAGGSNAGGAATGGAGVGPAGSGGVAAAGTAGTAGEGGGAGAAAGGSSNGAQGGESSATGAQPAAPGDGGSSSGGSSAPGVDGGPEIVTSADDGGCGCTVPASPSHRGAGMAAFALALSGWLRRRRPARRFRS